jgi:hypothetical protein
VRIVIVRLVEWGLAVMVGGLLVIQLVPLLRHQGLVKVSGTVDGHPFTSSFVALGHGSHTLPIKADLRSLLGKAKGDRITVHLTERFER